LSIGELTEGPPRAIGRYEIVRELGRGAMGVVYEARDPALGRTIALKTIHPRIVGGPDDREAFEARFFAEARIAAGLSHPGIVVVHDVGRDPESGTLYIALERLKGRTLAELCAGGRPLPWRETLPLLGRIARSLFHAHTHGIVHRDMKPANVMVLDSGETKIMDFGIAKIEASLHHLTTPGEFLGTPLYMAPEQASGGAVTPRTDVFALGAIGYSLLTGRAAFAGDTVAHIVLRVVTEDPGPPSRVVPDIPPEVDGLIARALAKSPDDRYPDAETMAEDVEAVLAGQPPIHLNEAPTGRIPVTLARPQEVELVVAEDPIERAFRDLVTEGPGAQTGLAPTPSAPASAASSTATPQITTHTQYGLSPGPRAPASRPLLLGLLAVVVLGAAAYLGGRNFQPASGLLRPSSPPASLVAGTVPASTPGADATSPPSTAPGPTDPGWLSVDLEHPLKAGKLRIWLDEDLVVDQKLAGQTDKKLLVFSFSTGHYRDVLEVKPGRHAIKVQLAWEDTQRTERILGTFKPGITRRLEVRLGRIRKNLSLDWQ
jgi:serine/threonine protein kinase